MGLVLVRIDDRLVHGQVLEGWVPVVEANHIVVIQNRQNNNDLQRAIFSIALPTNLKVSLLPVEEVSQQLNPWKFGEDRVLLLSPSPREILYLLQQGIHFDRVNVGGLHYAFGRIELGKPVTLSQEDKAALLEIARLGVKLEGRATPTEKPTDIVELLKEQL